MPFNISSFRQQYPQFDDVDSYTLAKKVYDSNPELSQNGVTFESFAQQSGVKDDHIQRNPVQAEDYARSFKVGLDRFGQLLGRGLDVVGLDQAGQAVENLYKEREQKALSEQSPAYRAEMEKRFIEKDPVTGERRMGEAWTSPSKITGMLVESAPEMAVGMGTGAGIAKSLIKIGMSGPLAGMIGGAIGEGGMAGVDSAKTAYDTVMSAPTEVLSQSPEFNDALARTGDYNAARREVARGAAYRAGLSVGMVTGILGAPSGAALGKVISEGGKSIGSTALRQGIHEAAQEAPQSAFEQYQQNKITQRYVDPTIDPYADVEEAAAAGGVTGFVSGGMLGGLVHKAPIQTNKPTDLLNDALQPEPAIQQPALSPEPTIQQSALSPERVLPESQSPENIANPRVAPMRTGPVPTEQVEPQRQFAQQPRTFRQEIDPIQVNREMMRDQYIPTPRERAIDARSAQRERQRRVENSDQSISGMPYAAGIMERTYGENKQTLPPKPIMAGTPEGDRLVSLNPIVEPWTDLDVKANESAASPQNNLPAPTEAQQKVGNYKKGHIKYDGLDISIENPAGSTRTGTDSDGETWQTQMQSHYGYVKDTVGRDKDHLDVFIKPGTETSPKVYVVDQVDPKTGRFDEHKIVMGANSVNEAAQIYQSNYEQDWGGGGGITEMSMGGFKKWAFDGKRKTKPLTDLPFAKKEVPDGLQEGETQGEITPMAEVAQTEQQVSLQTEPFQPTVKENLPVGVKETPSTLGDGELNAKEITKQGNEKEQVKSEKIEDFGEKIGGARKDYYAEYSEKLKDVDDGDIASMPLSKAWPEPDYNKLKDSGVDPWVIGFVRASREEIPNKPKKGYKLKRWVESVKMFRSFASDLLDGSVSKEKLQSLLEKDEFSNVKQTVGGRAELYEIFGYDKPLKGVTMSKNHYSLYRGQKNVDKWIIERSSKATALSNMPRELAVGNTKKEALEQFKIAYSGIGKADKTAGGTKFIIYRKTGESGWYVGKKLGGNYIDLVKRDSATEAREYMKNNQAELEAMLERYKKIPEERRISNRERVGVDHRGGKDVTPEMFNDAFGFRGVEFGNWVNNEERQDNLNQAYDALADLANVLNIPGKAISLNGELGIGFGSRGHGGKRAPSAHYEPSKIVINLTKKNGPGSLAHEWWHALDNYFSRQRGTKSGYMFESPYPVSADDTTRLEIFEAFKNVISAVKDTGLKSRSQNLDKRRSKAYWSEGREMAARTFENYVIEKLNDSGASNDYLVNIVPSKEYAEDMIDSLLSNETLTAKDFYPYLEKDEIPAVKKAYDDLFKIIKTRETDRGIELYSTKNASAMDKTTPDIRYSKLESLGTPSRRERKITSGITLKGVQSLFPGQSVGLLPNGDIWVRTKNGRGVTISNVDHIKEDSTSFNIAYGRMKESGEFITGKYQEGKIEISKVGDKWTLSHETTHWLEDSGILNKIDINILKNHINMLSEKGKFTPENKDDIGGAEDRANFVADHLYGKKPAGRLRKILNKVVDFIDRFMNFVGKRTVKGVVRDIESGEIYNIEPQENKNEIKEQYSIKSKLTEKMSDEKYDNARSRMSKEFDGFMAWLVDKNRPIMSVQKKLSEIGDNIDVFMHETQRPKIAAAKIHNFWEESVRPLISQIAKDGYTVGEVEAYSHAKHAPEANEHLKNANSKRYLNSLMDLLEDDEVKAVEQKIKKARTDKGVAPEAYNKILNETFNEFGDRENVQKLKEKWDDFSSRASGMTNQEAEEILKQYEGDEKIENIREMLHDINSDRLELIHDAGLIPEETYQSIKNNYEFYVPLAREGYNDSLFGVTRGLNPTKAIKIRGGSTRKVVDIVANTIANYEKAVNQAEKAVSTKALRDLVRSNPDPELWTLKKEKKSPRYDDAGNITLYPDMFNVADNEFRFMVGGEQYILEVNRDNHNAMMMLRTLKASDSMHGPILNFFARINRVLAAVNTSWSPEFIISNMLRDFQTANVNIKSTEVKPKKMMKGAKDAIAAIARVEFDKKKGSEYENLYERFKLAGGKISWSDVHQSVSSLTKKLTAEIEEQQGKRPVMKTVKTWLDAVDKLNTSIENGIRLHAFKLAVDQGLSDKKAAQIASDLTVDFTKKGYAGPVINSLYLFANAGIQGSYRIMRGAFTGPNKRVVQKHLAQIVGMGFTVAMFNALAGGTDEDGEDYYNKIEPFIKERNIIIMLPGTDGKYAKIPLPWGYNLFWNLGGELASSLTAKNYKPLEGAMRLGETFANAFNPIQSGTLLQTLSPTITDPFVQVAENKNWFGGPLMPEKNTFEKVPTPDSQRYWKSARVGSVWIAEQLNSLFGGDKIKKGAIDISPETLDLVIDTVGGSALRFFTDAFEGVAREFRDEKTDVYRYPFIRKIYGEKSGHSDSQIYYDHREEILTLSEQLKTYKGTEYFDKLLSDNKKEAGLIVNIKAIEKRLAKLRRMKRKMQANGADTKKVDEAMNNLYIAFNKLYNERMK